MLFDEPTSALDPEMISEVLDVMVNLAERHDHALRDPRDGLRAGGQPGDLHGRRRDHRAERPEEFFNNPQSDRTKLFLSQILHHWDGHAAPRPGRAAVFLPFSRCRCRGWPWTGPSPGVVRCGVGGAARLRLADEAGSWRGFDVDMPRDCRRGLGRGRRPTVVSGGGRTALIGASTCRPPPRLAPGGVRFATHADRGPEPGSRGSPERANARPARSASQRPGAGQPRASPARGATLTRVQGRGPWGLSGGTAAPSTPAASLAALRAALPDPADCGSCPTSCRATRGPGGGGDREWLSLVVGPSSP